MIIKSDENPLAPFHFRCNEASDGFGCDSYQILLPLD